MKKQILKLLEENILSHKDIADQVGCTDRYVRKVKAKWLGSDTTQYEASSVLSALKTDGTIMTIDEYCDYYGIPREQARTYKLVTHTSKGAYYNIASNVVSEGSDFDLDLLKQNLKKALKNVSYKGDFKRAHDRPIVLSIADLHGGAYVDNLKKTKPYSIDILAKLLAETAEITNSHNSKMVNVHILGDLIESFTGLNHINSWKGLHKGMTGARIIKLMVTLLHENLLSRITNLNEVKIIAGNHDRVTSNKAEDTDGDAADLIAWGLSMIGYKVDFDPFVLSYKFDNIRYVLLHGDQGLSRKSTENIILNYGEQGVYNVVNEAHLHSLIGKRKPNVKEIKDITDDSINYRRVTNPSFFTGNSYSERLGFTSNSGFIIWKNNGRNVPHMLNYTL